MSSIALIADVHLGNHLRFGGTVEAGCNRRFLEGIATLERAEAIARRNNCTTIISLGDLFDTPKPLPQHERAVQRVIEASGLQWILLVGNHDQVSNKPDDNALAPLRPCAIVVDTPEGRVLEEDGTGLLLVPFQYGSASEWFVPTVERLLSLSQVDAETKLLLFHLGIRDDATPDFLKNAPDSIAVGEVQRLITECGIDGAAAGNWHERRRWDGPVVQVGTLCPTGWDNPGPIGYGRMAIWNGQTFKTTVVPGPRFFNVSSASELEELLALEMPPADGWRLYVRWNCEPEDIPGTQALLDELVVTGRIQVGSAEPIPLNLEQSSVAIAADTQREQTIETALPVYVDKMDLGPSVNRGEVLEESRRYLGLGAK